MWVALSAIEMLCAVGLVLPALHRPAASLAPIAAACIVAEMLIFSGLHLRSGVPEHGEVIYWLVVATACAFVAYGRLAVRPL